jgi:hypothetical protein
MREIQLTTEELGPSRLTAELRTTDIEHLWEEEEHG